MDGQVGGGAGSQGILPADHNVNPAPKAVRLPELSSAKRSTRRSRICWGDSIFTRAAASSMASAEPSTRRQISMTARMSDAANARSGRRCAARSRKRRTDS